MLYSESGSLHRGLPFSDDEDQAFRCGAIRLILGLMTFLYPGFLLALLVLIIPVVIHLFNFRRIPRVFFSNTRFLRRVEEASASRRKLKYYLVLLSRLLFLTFLVFAFAQPFIPASEQITPGKNVIIYLDNSYSMSGQVASESTAFEEAIQYAHQITHLFPADARYRFLTNDFDPFSYSTKTRDEVEDELTQVKLAAVSRSATEIIDHINQMREPHAEIFWISDFQRSTLGNLDLKHSDSTARWHLVPLSLKPAANIFVDTTYLVNPFIVGGERNSLLVKLRNSGDEPEDQVRVKLLVNGIQAGTSTVSVPAGGSTPVTFDLTEKNDGYERLAVELNDNPINFDNEFYVTLNFSERMRVVEIRSTTTPTPVERVFGNPHLFSFTSFLQGNINFNAFNDADLVVLDGLDVLRAPLIAALSTYRDHGGSLLLVPGTQPDVASYSALAGKSDLQAVTVPQEAMELDRPDLNNPFYSHIFEDQSDRVAMPSAKKIIAWGPDPSALLKFRDAAPFLSQVQGPGKLYLMASPLQTEYTDLFNNAIFVPIMYRMAAGGKKNDFNIYYTLSQPVISVRFDSLHSDVPLRLIGREEIVPEQRKVGNRVDFELPRFLVKQGFYNVVFGRDTIATVAFNLDSRESFLQQFSSTDLKAAMSALPSVSLFQANSADTFGNEIKERYLGKPLWKYALAIALAFLFTEILLLRFLK